MLETMRSFFKYVILFGSLLSLDLLMAQVGINTDNPTTMLDVNGNLSLNSSLLILNNGDNNIPADDHSLFTIIGPTADFNINTIQPLAEVDGQIITLVNTTPYSMTLKHEDSSGLNSILCTSNGDLILKGIYTTVTLQYLKSIQRWITVTFTNGESSKKRIFSSQGGSDIDTDSLDFVTMPDMALTLTPNNSTIFVSVSLSGIMDVLGSNDKPSQGYGDFRLKKIVESDTTIVAGFSNLATDADFRSSTNTAWNARLVMFPIAVTPGESILLQLEWRVLGENPGLLRSIPQSSPGRSHRSIAVLD